MYGSVSTTFLRGFTTVRTVPRIILGGFRLLTVAGRGRKAPTKTYPVDFESLQVFKALHGHLWVSRSCSLSPDTPGVGRHALRLGNHVNKLRTNQHRIAEDERTLLSEMGFIWDVPTERFKLLVEGIVTYRKLYGDYLVESEFVVPDNDPQWPKKFWGMKLGWKFHALRLSTSVTTWHNQYLEKHGISLDPLYLLKAERIVVALEAYKVNMKISQGELFIVPRSFTIPSDDNRWETSLWGLPLGTAVHSIRYKNTYADHHDKFRNIGLRLDRDRRGDTVESDDRDGNAANIAGGGDGKLVVAG